jgi:hypothetical protein
MRKHYFMKINQTLFAIGKDSFPYAYTVTSFRKRSLNLSLSQLRQLSKKANQFEGLAESLDSTQVIGIVEDSKKRVYCNRIDLERDLDTVISPMIPMNCNSLKDSFDLFFNGKGYSAFTGKQLKSITCIEKREKALKAISDKLADLFNK